jgi:peptide deformylase
MDEKKSILYATLLLILTFAIAICLLLIPKAEAPKGLDQGSFTQAEKTLIANADSVMHVFTVNDSTELKSLRSKSTDLSDSAILSSTFRTLSAKLIATVTSPEQNGVGISAPQVGINRKVIAVMRYDKPGKPFEIYVNPSIDTLIEPIVRGPEGCLSVPGMRGMVSRYNSIVLSYKDLKTLQPRKDTVSGYSAIIFQHECDHLEGILYTDKADTVFVDKIWQAEINKNKHTK